MRITYAAYLEVSLDGARPEFFDSIAEYPFAKGIDRGAYSQQFPLGVFPAFVKNGECPQVRQTIERYAKQLADSLAPLLGIKNWPQCGRVVLETIDNQPIPPTHALASANPAIRCPECNSPMVQRQGPRGDFYGCQNYPECKGTRAVS
jgi:hypothetical protein